MPTEIERKFLVTGEAWRQAALGPGRRLRQGYLAPGGAGAASVRVRLSDDDGFLTIKGPGLLSRAEYEYPIPAAHALAMLGDLCPPPVIEKTRTRVAHAGMVWEWTTALRRYAGQGKAYAIARRTDSFCFICGQRGGVDQA
jgi:CYTH domain-containing protein